MLGSQESLATGEVSRRDLAHRSLTLNLHAVQPASSDGYVSMLQGGLSLTLRRSGRVSQQVIGEPGG